MFIAAFLLLLAVAANAQTTPTTLYVIDIGSYCANQRAIPYYLSTTVPGATLSTAQIAQQQTCISGGSYNPNFYQNVATGNIYALLCNIVPAGWTTPTYVDTVPPCSIGWSGCPPGQFNLQGYSTQTYCTGSYTNVEQFPPMTVSGGSGGNNCFPISGCSVSLGTYWGLATNSDPTNPADYYIFQYNCFPNFATQVKALGYVAAPNVQCNNFSIYASPAQRASPGPAQAGPKAPLLSKGGIVGVVIAGIILIVGVVLFAFPPVREMLVAKGHQSIAKVKELTGKGTSENAA